MFDGRRIRERRIELKISQEELALKVGYKSKSTVNKIEHNERDIQIDKVEEFAKALAVSPCFLMGWEDSTGTPICGKIDEAHALTTKDLLDLISKHLGDDTKYVVASYIALDDTDKAELRGELKHMMKSDKYSFIDKSKLA